MGIKFIDTTIRDGQASLWAMNMRTAHMIPVMPYLDQAGFDQAEFFAPGSRMKKFIRDLHENPWDWIRTGAKLADKLQLRWHGGMGGGGLSGPVPKSIEQLFIRKVVDLGITFTRTGNNWNDFDLVRQQRDDLLRLGMTSVINIMYSVSPKHTDEYFLRKTKEAVELEPYRLAFKDVGGLLTPERTRNLLPKMMSLAGSIPWEFHGHCNNGLGPLNALEAVHAGVEYIHTAIPPLANGSSQPSIFNVAANLRALGYEPEIDEAPLLPVQVHLTEVAEKEGFPLGVPHEYEVSQYDHQVPGGMISNLKHQLKLIGRDHQLPQVLEEAGRVRADFGYPIMVTPLSQFVGSQAAINVIVGERYKQVTDEVISYALGRHGGTVAIAGMNPEVRAMILNRPRARELEDVQRHEPSIKDLRKQYGENISDEDLILRAMFKGEASSVIDRNSSAGLSSNHPLIKLVERLTTDQGYRYISIGKGSSNLQLGTERNR